MVLDAAMGCGSDTWTQMQSRVAQSTRVCSYDRASLGKSDAVPPPRNKPADERRHAYSPHIRVRLTYPSQHKRIG